MLLVALSFDEVISLIQKCIYLNANGYSLWIPVVVLWVYIDHVDELHMHGHCGGNDHFSTLHWKCMAFVVYMSNYTEWPFIPPRGDIHGQSKNTNIQNHQIYSGSALLELCLLLMCTLLTIWILIYQLLCLSHLASFKIFFSAEIYSQTAQSYCKGSKNRSLS